MKKLVQLNCRITVLLDVAVDDYCSKINITKSKLVFDAISQYVKSKGYKEIVRNIDIDRQRENIREQNYQLYLIKNTFMTIINMAKMDLIQHTQININKVILEIKECKRLYNLFPQKIKNLLKDDIKQIEKLRYKNNIMQYMSNWDLIQEFMGIKKPMRPMKRLELK